MATSQPLVSILVPAYNHEDYVSTTVEIANTNPDKLLQLKKYYAECAEKYLYKNDAALKSFQDIIIALSKGTC